MIYFIRHGQSEANVKGIFAGQKENSPLTELGIEQAHQSAQSILKQNLAVDHIITSPLKRTNETATIIAKDLGYNVKEIHTDNRITEYDMGSLTGTPIRKVTSAELISAKGAENATDFHKRVKSFIDDYGKSPDGILVVSHAGVARMIKSIELNEDPNNFYNIDPLSNGEILHIT